MILAAGASSRLGQPKQLVTYKGQTLISHAIKSALEAKPESLVIVLGANASQITGTLEYQGIHTVLNEHWRDGMSSSIVTGIKEVLRLQPGTEYILFMLTDQPMVSAELLRSLYRTIHSSGKPAVACTYDGINGIPAIFQSSLFPALLGLTGDKGARIFLKELGDDVATVPFPGGTIDIDTPDDMKLL